jgi:hypothetical protein
MLQLVRTMAACFLLLCGLASITGGQTQPREPLAVPGIIPTGLGESIDRDVARLRAATARFKAVDAAIAAGYAATAVCVAHPSLGAMGLHYKNAALRDATLDVEHPEILLYAPMPDGSPELTGVEFVVPFTAWTHEEPPTVLMQKLRREETLKIWYLHAWIWQANTAGIFADWNPDVKC